MRDVCRDCKFEKDHGRDGLYCTKYGMILISGRIFCISYDPKCGGNFYVGPENKVRQQKADD
ncbi:MAG: hypothetical protein J6Y20_12415 [Lachnospiraceae bacterium]|nr:hypothetical protein [Lachnospiraceae bacterium]